MTSISSVLIVDDEPTVRDLMSRWVTSLGLRSKTAADADEALVTLRGEHYDLAIVDVLMPGHDGLWLASQMQRDHPHTAVVIATAYTALLSADGPRPEIADLLVKPFQRERFTLALERGGQWRKDALEDVQWHAALSKELSERSEAICAEVRECTEASSAIDLLTTLMAERVPDVLQHGGRVARYARAVGRELSVDDEAGEVLWLASQFHDLGKAAMSDALLTKPSPLTPGEVAIMRRHVDIGADILACVPALAPAAPVVRATHEWIGGGGYPRRLAGVAIPLASRIIAVVDAYDSMTELVRDRTAVAATAAVSELLRCGGTQFDPDVVTAFLAVLARH